MKIIQVTCGILILISLGCFGSGATPTNDAPDAIGDFNPYEILDAEKIGIFQRVMKSLPEGQMPDFAPPKVPGVSHELSPEQYAEKFKTNLKQRIDPNLFAEGFKNNSELREAANKQGLSMQGFAALMIQISLAYTAESLGDKMDILKSWKEGETLAEQEIANLKAINDAKLPLTDPETARKRDVSIIKLEFALAQCYFCELLYHVPAESKLAIKPAMTELKKFLPDPESQIPKLENKE